MSPSNMLILKHEIQIQHFIEIPFTQIDEHNYITVEQRNVELVACLFSNSALFVLGSGYGNSAIDSHPGERNSCRLQQAILIFRFETRCEWAEGCSVNIQFLAPPIERNMGKIYKTFSLVTHLKYIYLNQLTMMF